MRVLALICAVLICGCSRATRQTAATETSQPFTILDEVLAKPEFSNSVVEAQQDLPTDKWQNEPYHFNASREGREYAVGERMLAEVRPQLRQMSLSNLVASFKVITHPDGIMTNDFKGVAAYVYMVGNQSIINEIKSRPTNELRGLPKLGSDRVELYEGPQGFGLSLRQSLYEILDELHEGLKNGSSQ